MNTENILKLANLIEFSETYDQTCFKHLCGTPACIAGHAVILAGGRLSPSSYDNGLCLDQHGGRSHARVVAKEWMGLNERQANDAFDPCPYSWDHDTTPQDAAAMLRHLAETGKVEWPEEEPR